MNWIKILSFNFVALLLLVATGCGVKGDPLPPKKPPHLGRGKPTFKRAIKNIVVDPNAPMEENEDVEEEKEEEEE